MCCEKFFLHKLHEQGLRLTPQREMVLDVLHHMDGHVTAEEIYERVQEHSAAVDISTVYRTLELLEEFHLVGVVRCEGQVRYELLSVHGHHHHIRCSQCGKLVRVGQEEIQPLVDHLQETYGFEAEPEHLIIPGLCKECQEAQDQTDQSETKAA
jgi:Fur family ferric uptake transcriptional regulator